MRLHGVWKAGFFLFCFIMAGGCEKKAPPAEDVASIRYTVVAGERVRLSNTLPGRVSALVVAEVRPQVDGIILERLFEEGADVVRGQVLYQIDPAIYQAARNTAQAELEEARAEAVALQKRESRTRTLSRSSAVSQQDLDDAIAEYGRARARIARAGAALETAAINLAYTRVTAPVSGRIGKSTVTPGALVTARQADPLAVIQQTDRMYVDITQSSTDMLRLRRAMAQGRLTSNGNAAKVRLTLEDGLPYTLLADQRERGERQWLLGELLFSEISVGQTTGSVSMRVLFSNPDGLLLPGMYVMATIEEGVLDNALLVPQGSVLSSGAGEHFVYILRPGAGEKGLFEVARRPVTLERAWGNRWIVKEGLAPGDLLVTEGLQKAVAGAHVRGIAEAPPAREAAAPPVTGGR